MEFSDKKLEIILSYLSLILSDMDFTNIKQYSLSKCFQLYRIAVNKSSLMDEVFSWTILKKFSP